MKRCPECRRDYYDDSLLYCLDDGTALLEGPSSVDESPTAILSEPPLVAGGLTQGSEESESKTAILQPPTTAGGSDTPSSIRSFNKRLLIAPLVLAAIVLAGFAGYRYFGSADSDAIHSIAVLPFENRSGNAEADYLSDGLTDSLIFRFSQLPGVKISPTSSVMRYKGKAIDVARVARELDVDAVLSGRLTQLGDSLDISVQLIDARSGKLIWAEQYDRKMTDLLATHREIATTLTQKMQLRLAGDERGITKKYTSSSEAYNLYLKGRFHWSRRSKDDLHKAIDSYKKAIELDPNFALAYAGIAETYNSMGKNPEAAPKDCIPLAKAAALRALEIDPMLPQAHSALGDSLAIYDWNWAESERHLKKAFEIDPNISYAHLIYASSFLVAVRRPGEGVTEVEWALELEPLSLINNSVAIAAYLNDRKFEKALEQGRKAFELDPTFPLARHWLGFALIANGQHDEAISLSMQASPGSTSAWLSTVVLGHAFAKTGKRAEAEKQIDELKALEKTRYVRSYYIASIYAALGDNDKAFAELERSFEDRDCYLGRVAVDPFMDPIRDDPRLRDLMRRMNLPE